MKLFKAVANWRRLVFALVVATVLIAAYLAPLPAAASKVNNSPAAASKHGNCGEDHESGYAYHDHGKPCPHP